MSISPLAGKPAPESILANVPRLVTDYFALEPDPASATERVAFGTSGHRGSSLACSFDEAHIAVLDRRDLTYPGVAVIKITRERRPRRLPRAGDEVAAAGPVQKSSDGSPEIRATKLDIARR